MIITQSQMIPQDAITGFMSQVYFHLYSSPQLNLKTVSKTDNNQREKSHKAEALAESK